MKRTYDSFAAAIAGALRHPLQRKAQADADRLSGTTMVDACWTDTDFVIRWSNDLLLHVYVDGEDVAWNLTKVPPRLGEGELERVGSPPVVLDWPREVGRRIMDRSAQTARRRGSEFARLFVNEMAFLVYCRGHLIWWFAPVRRTDLDRPMLFVAEEE